ncbi:MAG: MoaD/ThiS family protein [Caldimonas sp.]
MKVSIRYFASVREALGPGETLELASGTTVAAVRDALIARDAAHAAVLNRSRAIRSALDQVLCSEGDLVGEGAEIGFFPPVTGG